MRIPLPFVASGVLAATAVAAWLLARGPGSAFMIPQPGGVAVPLEAAPMYPLPEAPMRAMPSLDASDALLRGALERVGGAQSLLRLLAAEGLVRRFVASVHHASRRALPARLYPAVSAAGSDVARDVRSILGTADFARYDPYVRALEAIDASALVAVYLRLYPLFQEAYRAHVGEGRHFNDALVAAIDHLVATPPPPGPLVVLRRGAVRVYEDPGLEALSGGRKLMLRMGLDNAARVRVVLQEMRSRLALQPAGESQPARR
jgi:hypothetical protein